MTYVDDGITAMSEGLKCNTTLQILCVTVNDISDQACSGLAAALRQNKSLHTNSI